MAGTEGDWVSQWLYGYLAGDSALGAIVGARIYEGVAPNGAAYPYVRFDFVDPGTDVIVQGLTRSRVNMVIKVRAIGKEVPFSALTAAADRIEALFQAKSEYLVAQAARITAWREQAVRDYDLQDGVMYRHLGGQYQVGVQLGTG